MPLVLNGKLENLLTCSLNLARNLRIFMHFAAVKR
jgi:hypothetical protein